MTSGHADAIRVVMAMSVAVLAAAWDLTSGRIPNALTVGGALAGLVFSSVNSGWPGLFDGGAGALVGLALFFPLFAIGGMGGGDVKLLGAMGAWLGPHGILWAALLTAMSGGVLAIVVGLVRGYLGTAFRNLTTLLLLWRAVGPTAVGGITLNDSDAPRLAYGVAIAMGVGLTWWLGLA